MSKPVERLSRHARQAVNRNMIAMAKSVAPPNVGVVTIAVFPNPDGTIDLDVLGTLAPELTAFVLGRLAERVASDGMNSTPHVQAG